MGDAHISQGECSTYHSVIVAPERYFGTEKIEKDLG